MTSLGPSPDVSRVARDIRAGAFENNIAREAQLRQHLVIIARRKLAAAYPKGLQGNNN